MKKKDILTIIICIPGILAGIIALSMLSSSDWKNIITYTFIPALALIAGIFNPRQ